MIEYTAAGRSKLHILQLWILCARLTTLVDMDTTAMLRCQTA